VTETFDPRDDTWRQVLTRDDWPELLSAALRRAAVTLPTAVPFEIDDIAVVPGRDGSMLDIRYRTSTGLFVGRRWRATDLPAAGVPESRTALDVAAWIAAWIVRFEIGEPLGSYAEQLEVDSDGRGWWGAGYRVP
jgi:hypothetical protein